MSLEITPDLLEQQVNRRFQSTNLQNEDLSNFTIGKDLYLDVLCVFNNPDSFQAADFEDYPLQSILLYLRKTHELYKARSLQEIMLAIERLDRIEELKVQLKSSLKSFFKKFKSDLEDHIQEEETELFPYIESLLLSRENQSSNLPVQKNVLGDFLDKHDDHLERDLSNLVMALEDISESYTDSFAFRMILNRLAVLELDLTVHGKIEEEVLVPKARALEEEVFS